MKSKLLLFLAVVAMFSAFCLSVSAESPYTWVLDTSEALEAVEPNGCTTSIELGSLRVDVLTNDPKLYLELPEEFGKISADEYKYMSIRLKLGPDAGAGNGIVFVATDQDPAYSYSGATYFRLNDIDDDTGIDLSGDEWSNSIVDLTENGYWKSGAMLDGIRIDPFEPVSGAEMDALPGSVMYIERIGFFKTEVEAQKFGNIASQGYGETEFVGETHKVKIPAGVLQDGFKKEEYMLVNDVVAAGTNKDNRPVVFYTDAQGNKSVVSLCYTNEAGWTVYVANKAGKYSVDFNHKDYVDIAGHWGEDYINFVSDRALFGGTSPTEFSPEDKMTRGMFVTVLGRMHGLDTSKYDGNTGYADVPATEYYAPYIQWAKEIGIFAPVSATNFAPESVITREVMAVVIANYVKYYNYKFTSSAEPVEFNDLTGLSADSVAAIKVAQEAGIINGKGNGKFDPAGSSTRAEVATVMQRVIKGIVGVPTYNYPYTAEYIQRDRVRIGAYGFALPAGDREARLEYMKVAADLGIDFIYRAQSTQDESERDETLDAAAEYGVEVLVGYSPRVTASGGGFIPTATAEDVNPLAFTADYYEHPAFGGHEVSDEPGMGDYPNLSGIISEHYETLPGKIAAVNLLPMYANADQLTMGANAAAIEQYKGDPDLYKIYCDRFCEEFGTDYICCDIYPLNWVNGDEKETYRDYVESINIIATSAREHGKDFWCFIQAFGFASSRRDPTEQEFRWQCYSYLSFGCKTIILYTYDSTGSNGVLDEDGNPNQNYINAQPALQEVRRLSDTFIQYKNLGAFTLNCTEDTPYLRMSNEYTGFDVVSFKSEDPLLVGCFEKLDGNGHAFTVVNMVDFAAEDTSASFNFMLKDDTKTVTVYDKAEQPHVLKPTNNIYTIDLEEGQGVFVTIG
ncbi:MAG: S-layer homology domain-containing protein [Clostridia bacterium]|nr:S-layer homology domain-containing protein [Clostridia bacterium]